MNLADAQDLAARVVDYLSPFCERIEVAGSIRRQATFVRDIEVVCVPKLYTNLLGEPDPHQPHQVRAALERVGAQKRLNCDDQVIAWGQRYLACYYMDAPLDVFCVLPPADWGVIYAIRTGPRQLSTELVTRARRQGLRVEGGQLLFDSGRNKDKPIACPTEHDFFYALGLPVPPPEQR